MVTGTTGTNISGTRRHQSLASHEMWQAAENARSSLAFLDDLIAEQHRQIPSLEEIEQLPAIARPGDPAGAKARAIIQVAAELIESVKEMCGCR